MSAIALATAEGRRRAIPAPVSRFLVRHPKLSRFIGHIPGLSRFFTLPAIATVQPVLRSLGVGGHIKPVYNHRARKKLRPRFGP